MMIQADFSDAVRMTSYEIAEFLAEDHDVVMDHISGLAEVFAINMPVKEEVIYLRNGKVDVIEGYSFKGPSSRSDVAVLIASLETAMVGVVLANFDDRVEAAEEWVAKQTAKLEKKVWRHVDAIASYPLIDRPVG